MEEFYSFVTVNESNVGCKKEPFLLLAIRTNKQGRKIKLFLNKGKRNLFKVKIYIPAFRVKRVKFWIKKYHAPGRGNNLLKIGRNINNCTLLSFSKKQNIPDLIMNNFFEKGGAGGCWFVKKIYIPKVLYWYLPELRQLYCTVAAQNNQS